MDNKTSYGQQLENAGWLQTCVVKACEFPQVVFEALHLIGIHPEVILENGCILIVATQSCDIANQQYPIVEMRVAHPIEKINNAYAHNNHPRKLHLSIIETIKDSIHPKLYAINIVEKVIVSKELLINVEFCQNSEMQGQTKRDFKFWLAAQYTRPALPTEFNKRIDAADPKKSRKKAAKSLHKNVLGIYLDINPFTELLPEQQYSVNLLIMLKANTNESDQQILKSCERIQDLMTSAGMEVNMQLLKETNISVALLRKFTRIYLDDLSFRDDSAELPPDIEPTI